MRFRRKGREPEGLDPTPVERVRVVRLGSGEYAVQTLNRSLWTGEWEWSAWQVAVKHSNERAAIDEARERVSMMRMAEARASAEPKVVWP